DMTTDPKWQTIARKSGKPRALVIAIFTHLMLEANEADDRGSVADVNIEDVASAMDCDEEDVSAVLDAMQERVIVDGRLAGWERRQPKREDIGNPTTGAKSNTERSREHRKRKHDATQGNACNDDATQGNAPEAEAEAEAEAEKSKGAAAASPPRERVREAPPAAPPAKTEISEAPAEPPAAIPDEAPKRATQLAVLLRRNGADPRTVPNDRRIVAWARDGVSDAEALQALETAKARRKATGSDQPIGTAYLAPIVAAIRASPAGVLPSRNRSRQDRYAEEAAQIQAMARWADEELSKGSANAPLARIAG
ncbi:MAG TPA: hypothetical protein VF285_03155, partial [Castellaniella sp.]|uniref:hypothetical protein n=1 Tax=Castellaniella sp. TaxID=1955812 RepID=UPI002EFD9BC1